MKAWQLALALLAHPLADVVVDIHDHCSDFCAHEVDGVDKGWLPSGVLSVTIKKEPITY